MCYRATSLLKSIWALFNTSLSWKCLSSPDQHRHGECKQTDQREGPRCCRIYSGPPHRWARQTPAWQRCSPSPPSQLLPSSLLGITGTPGGRYIGQMMCSRAHCATTDYYYYWWIFLSLANHFKKPPRGSKLVVIYAGEGILQIPAWESLFFRNQLVMKRPTLELYSGKENRRVSPVGSRTHRSGKKTRQSERARGGASCTATIRPFKLLRMPLCQAAGSFLLVNGGFLWRSKD